MAKYLLLKHYRGGPAPVVDRGPMDRWTPAEIDAHLFRLMIDPVALGGGKRIFRDNGRLKPLHLLDSQVTPTGALLTTFAPADG